MSSGTGKYLFDVWGSSGSDIFAVGDAGTILHYDGLGWSPMSGTGAELRAVWGSSGSDVFAVGSAGFILHYDGSGWSDMSSHTGWTLYGVWGSSGSDVFAVGESGTIVHYDGVTWSPMSSGFGGRLWGVWGSSGNDVFAVGDAGTILHYDGTAWTAMSSGAPTDLHGVWGSSASDVFAVGRWGTILHTGGPDLALVKMVQPGTTLFPGEPITFTLSFNNIGTVTAVSALIADEVPLEVTHTAFDSSRPVTPTGAVSYTWLLGDLAPGGGGVITITGVVSPGLSPGHAFTNTATITATNAACISASNRESVRLSIQTAPVAVDDGYRTSEDRPLAVAAPGVLANDMDLNDDPLMAVLDSPPLSGTLILDVDGSFTYTPPLGFLGQDTFAYYATDTISDSNVATVTVHVDPLRFMYLPMVLKNQ
jgi:uncharacterized repeat protein (TIGR01451 family)